MILAVAAALLVTACRIRFWEPRAPERPFTPEDLLIDGDMLPSGWELHGPIFPAGDTLATTESASIGFSVHDEPSILGGTHSVYRHQTTGIARRTFEMVYLTPLMRGASARGWTYQSRVADQSHFGCIDLAGDVWEYCKWGGQYEEYIVVFGARVPPGEVSSASVEQMEKLVREIDARMAQYLGKPVGDTEG
jgi:hypothetical protein